MNLEELDFEIIISLKIFDRNSNVYFHKSMVASDCKSGLCTTSCTASRSITVGRRPRYATYSHNLACTMDNRRAVPQSEAEELRWWAALAAMLPLYFGAACFSIKHAKHFWDTAGQFQLIIVVSVVVCVGIFGSRLWGQHIPAKISWILAAIGWPLLFFLALTGRLV